LQHATGPAKLPPVPAALPRPIASGLLLLAASCAAPPRSAYPQRWWDPAPTAGAPAWEVLPQAAGPGEVILSKRNDLGILSNFAPTPFVYHGVRYASVEGFWQMMKYPEGPDDPRAAARWDFTRQQVGQMVAFDAKHAGDLGERNMAALGIDYVTFEGERMPYRSAVHGRHYQLIVDAMREKLRQNPQVRSTLLATGNLVLRPDHHQGADAPDEWRYFDLWMRFRSELQGGTFR
jgi:predicted NAD-dependent protein-ADP-ribosyltransferase YbiA (DUF1768 family)